MEIISRYLKYMVEKDASINTLKEQLAKLNIDVANLNANVETLTQETKVKQEVIEQKD